MFSIFGEERGIPSILIIRDYIRLFFKCGTWRRGIIDWQVSSIRFTLPWSPTFKQKMLPSSLFSTNNMQTRGSIPLPC